MDSILIPIAVLVIGLILLVLELFVPSGGVIGILAVICILAAIVLGFMIDVKIGILFLVLTVILVPALLGGMLKVWPHTPLGKNLFAQPPQPDEVLPDDERYREFKELVGKRGIAKTKMLPSGSIRVNNRTYDAVSNGVAIDPGESVEVIAIRANHIVVRPVKVHKLDPANPGDILAQSPETLGLDDWDEPLDPLQK
jgi:membrane-bound serine protease (ClpP class)